MVFIVLVVMAPFVGKVVWWLSLICVVGSISFIFIVCSFGFVVVGSLSFLLAPFHVLDQGWSMM
jgi:hypothetical protein